MSERRIFVNLTAHRLTDVQIEEVKEFADEVVNADEILSKEMIQKLRQCPSDVRELYDLAYELSENLKEYARSEGAHLYVHLPTGSPAFMWVFGYYFPHTYCSPVFSHTRRVVEEVPAEGRVVKRSVFKFEGFIFPDGR